MSHLSTLDTLRPLRCYFVVVLSADVRDKETGIAYRWQGLSRVSAQAFEWVFQAGQLLSPESGESLTMGMRLSLTQVQNPTSSWMLPT